MSETKKIQRKLQAIGRSLVTTLPNKWIKSCNLNKGDYITIKELSDGSLKIVPSLSCNDEYSEEVEIDFFPEVGREILEKCLSGAKKIKITSSIPINRDHLAQIRYFVHKIPTTMITSEKAQEIIVNNFGVKDFPSDEILRSIFSKVLDLFKNVRERDVNEIEYNINEIKKIYMLLIQYTRTYLTTGFLHQKDYKDFDAKKASDYREISNYLRDISFILESLDFFEDGLEFYNKVESYFTETFDAFLFNRNDKKAYKLFFKNLWAEGETLKNNNTGDLRYMIKDLLKIFYKTSDILSITTILK